MNAKLLAQLFLTFAKVGVMTFGGGMAMLPILQREVVENKGWATDEELTDYFAIGLCTPGVISVNTATFIGQKQRGIAGGIVATLGVVLQPFLLKRADWLNCVLYLCLGWAITPLLGDLIDSLAPGGVWLLAAGGVVYSLGVIFYLIDRIPYNHAIWHVFVLAGTALQFFSVFFYVLPPV